MTPRASLYCYHPSGAPPLSSDEHHQRQQAATAVLASLAEPAARTHRSGEPWRLDKPIEQLPHTTAYETRLPTSLSPAKLRASADAVPKREEDEADALPSFSHCRPRPPPAAPPPLAAPTPSLVPPPGTQGILRARYSTVAGAWAAAEDPKREKKKVRVESPRQSAIKGLMVGNEEAVRRKPGRVLVPATPVQQEERGEEAEEQEKPALASGAIQRCIPYPHAHTAAAPCSDPNPSRQHPARVLHSCVDPTYARTTLLSGFSSTASLGASLGTSLAVPQSSGAQSHPLTRTSSNSSHHLQHLQTTSPSTFAYLAPGRRGSWLIPVGGPLPKMPKASGVRWFASPPTSPPAVPRGTPLPIDWTDARLSTLWAYLDYLNTSSSLGSLRATCVTPPRSLSSAASASSYIKITTDAHLALALRGVLNQLNIKSMERQRLAESGGEASTGSTEASMDGEKFLKGRALLWVDEQGKAVLIA